jgi:hydroxymethylbilane synthase
VAAQLTARGVTVELVPISTQGDVTTQPLGVIGGQGLFTKELQRALLDRRIDLAVHSLKDLPTLPVPGLSLAAVPPRESTRDVLVSAKADCLEALPAGARVGTGSNRRRAQLLNTRPDLQVSDIRGNVDTRLRKLDEGQFEAIVLAEAGLRRLGLDDRIAAVIPRSVMLPAAGQGALGIETRTDAVDTRSLLEPLDDRETHAAVEAERALLASLQAGCLAPVGVWARIEDGQLQLDAAVLSPDGCRRLAVAVSGDLASPRELGQAAAARLLDAGAGELVAASRTHS